MAKRSIVSEERLSVLNEKGTVYVITCGIVGCTCEMINGQCERGFFSLFIQVVYGIHFANSLNLPYHVDFTNAGYCYTDPLAGKGPNFWNYYFRQPIPAIESQASNVVINDFIEMYPLRIWDRGHLRTMYREVVGQLAFQDEVKELINGQRSIFSAKKVIGVQIRCTDHAVEVEPIPFEKYIKAIRKRIRDYDSLFVATDDQRIIVRLKEVFGDKLLYNDVLRAADDVPLHTDPSLMNRYKLGLDVLVDCYSLSLCDYAFLIHSNISYAALLFNPNLSYTLMETRRTKLKKWKTMLAFYLNKWGIRKW